MVQRALRHLLDGLGLVVVAVVALFFGALIHVRTPCGLRAVTHAVNEALRGTFRGSVEIRRIHTLGADGLTGLDATVLSPSGKPLIWATGVDVRADVPKLVQDAILGGAPLEIRLTQVSVEHVAVDLSVDEGPDRSRVLAIADAFAAKKTTPKNAPSGPPPSVLLDAILVQHAWVYGQPTSGFVLDAEARDVHASFRVDAKGVALRVPEGSLLARNPLPGIGIALRAGGALVVPTDGELVAHVVLAGSARGERDPRSVAFVGEAKLAGTELEARVGVPTTEASLLKAVEARLPLRGAMALHAEARGRIDGHLEARARANLGDGALDVHGHGTWSREPSAELGFAATGFALTSFARDAPSSRLGLEGTARLELESGGAPTVDADVVLAPDSHIAEQPLPPTQLHATLDQTGLVIADLLADEPGARTKAHAELPRGGLLTFASRTEVKLGALTRAAPAHLNARGTAALTTRGTLDPSTQDLVASATLTGRDLEARGTRAAELRVAVAANGAVRAPRLHVDLEGKRLRLGETRALGRFDVSTDLTLTNGITLRNTRANARTRGESLSATIPTLHIHGAEWLLEDARVEGLGTTLVARGSKSGRVVSASAHVDDLDLGRLARLVGDPEISGHLALDTNVRLAGNEAEGDVRLALRDASLPGIPRASATVDASLHARRGRVDLDLVVGDAISARTKVESLELHGPALDASTWPGADGHGWLDADIDLTRLADAIPKLKDADYTLTAGRAHVQAGFSHERRARLPSVDVALSTRGLALRSRAAGRGVHGLDVAAEARVDGTTGHTALSTRLFDAHGALILADAKGELPLDLVAEGASFERLRDAWLVRPFGARIASTERNLSDLNVFFDTRGVAGTGSFLLTVDGSPRAPNLRLDVAARELKPTGAAATSVLDAALVYDGKSADLLATLTSGDGVARLDARGLADLAHVLGGRPFETLPWRADAVASFERFALASVPSPSGIRVRGLLDGKISIADLHHDAKLDVSLDATALTVAQAPIPRVAIRARAGGGEAHAQVRVDQPDGFAQASGHVGLAWAAELVPKVDKSRSLEARIEAKSFRAAVLAPFTAQLLTDLDGRIDGTAALRADADLTNVTAEGMLVARDFSFVLAAVGQEYRDVGAKLTVERGGIVHVDEVHASDGIGRLTGAAVARFDGLTFVGANAVLHIPKTSPMDVVTEGQSLGDAYGDVSVSMRNVRMTKTLDVHVDVPTLHLNLLESAGRHVQELKARDDVHVGLVRNGRLVELALTKVKAASESKSDPKDDTSTSIAVSLGRDVELRRGSQVVVQLTGTPRIRIANGRTEVLGQVQLTSGSIDLSGRKFTVEKGTVTFGQDPKNPIVIATATWTAADRSRVYADFVGPIRTGKLTLRSEPARTQSEILTLIAFGTTDGPSDASNSRGTSTTQGTQVATAVGAGTITEGFDAALDGVTGLRTQTRIDATNAQNPRPELEVQVSRDVSLRFAYVLGTPPPSEPDKSLGTVIFRFAPNWSLSTTVGDKGKATMDTMWQYRY